MKVHVDMAVCERYGHCCFEAPDVFTLDDAGELHYVDSPPDTARAGVDAAIRACPVRAITATLTQDDR